MWATASPRARAWVLAGWTVFAAANLWLMWTFEGGVTIPFHFVWISIALVFGVQTWPLRAMIIVLGIVTVATGAIMLHHALVGAIGIEETTEVPLMAAVFLVMVWHVRHRQLALAELERVAAADRNRAEAQQAFVRLVSHELRTPITVVRGYVELIKAAHDDPQTTEDADIVLAELQTLDHNSARLTTLMQLDSPTHLESVDIDALLQHLVRRWSAVARRQWSADGNGGAVVVDRERLVAALDSLVENSIKFTDHGDRIGLTAHRERGSLVIEVRDTGEGIPQSDLPFIFDRFRSGAKVGVKAGSGLGLAIARAAAEARGGTISVRSTVGVGTTFTMRVPLRPSPEQHASSR
jgi:two-component system OmpR family sensor kinase